MNKGIILTTYRFREDDCIHEAWQILNIYGYGNFEVLETGMPGIVVLKVDFDPVDAVEKLIEYAKENAWSIKYILRAIPLEIIVEANEESIVNAAKLLVNKIKESNSYRISIDKRETKLSSENLISKIAGEVKGKVNLKDYEYIVLIETIKELAGISVIKREQIFVLHKIKQLALKEIKGKETIP